MTQKETTIQTEGVIKPEEHVGASTQTNSVASLPVKPKISYLIFHVDRDREITRGCLTSVRKEIKTHKGEHLYIILQTLGGDPFSAAAIMTFLRKRFSKITVVIPEYAKSAGTLMALGADEIYMSEHSALGPLDLPIEHPVDGSRISALDVSNTITNLAALSETMADSRYDLLRSDKFHLSRLQAAKLAMEIATDFVRPIVAQVDPYHLQKSYRELKIGLYYAFDLLTSGMMKGDTSKAITTARALVNDYPAHEYSIFPDEARAHLQLNIKDLSTLTDWKTMEQDFLPTTKSNNYAILYREK